MTSSSDTSSFIVRGDKSPFQSSWSRTQKRLYHRAMSGFEMAKRSNDFVRVMVLTSSPESDPDKFHRHFEAFKKRIRRKFGRFEYVAVKEHTKTGLVHLHLMYRGRYISQEWLSDTWNEVHKAPVVWIAKLYSWRLAKHLARYFIKEGFGRFWNSWQWVYRGFMKDWHRIVSEKGRIRALGYWHRWLWIWTPEVEMFQDKLFISN